jgi:hypothetical protein
VPQFLDTFEFLHQHEIIIDSSMLTRLQSAYAVTLDSVKAKQSGHLSGTKAIKALCNKREVI